MMQSSIQAEGNPFMEPRAKRAELYPVDAKGLVREGDARTPELLVWAGCVNSYQDINTLPAFMKILDAAGVTYKALGPEEGCCGYVAYITGMPAFEDIARGAAGRISASGAPVVVTPCAGCAKSFRKVWPEHGIELGPRPLHAVELFEQLIKDGRLKLTKPFAKKVVWHDPCDIGRHLRIFDAPRNVLKAVPGLELVEMAHSRERAIC
jgi:Fe-S oxidoreductase